MNVDFFQNIYRNKLEDNEKHILFWEKHIQELLALDLDRYVRQLTVPILVPIGSKILFRGELKHTNEVTVALGADYFAKCSVEQAQILIKHRVEVASSKLADYKAEKEYLQNQLSLTTKTLNDESGCDIVEHVTEEEDKNWRIQHRENVRKYKQSKLPDNEASANEMSNEQLWNRLEELELQEELDNELQKGDVNKPAAEIHNELQKGDVNDPAAEIHNELQNGDVNDPAAEIHGDDFRNMNNMPDWEQMDTDESSDDDSENDNMVYRRRRSILQEPSKFELFEKVVHRHKELKKQVARIRARQGRLVTEADMLGRVGDLEKLEQLEDEISMLEDILASDDDDIEGEEDDRTDKQEKKSVVFADDDDCDTFEITFKHSEVEPSSEPYDPLKGITKPSDILKAYPGSFSRETTSILKKAKCDSSPEESQTKHIVEEKPGKEDIKKDSNSNSTIIVKDVVERTDCGDKNVKQTGKPMSLFKKRRQQLKE